MPADEGLHEIQLNGKQLVFLFMASTVVAVVIFLCGVMVGRGVRAQRPALETAVEAATDPTSGATSDVPLPPATAVTSNAPIAAQETLTYPSRLDGQEPVEERLRPGSGIRDQGSGIRDQGSGIRDQGSGIRDQGSAKSAPTGAAKPVVAKREPPKPVTPAASAATPSATASSEPAGNGFVVQVAAVNDRREAETIATRLAGKGYPSFVTTPPNGAARMFRVRIGKYPTRREAAAIAARLQKEDQFRPWITK
jgi:cell division septation protein DedD